MKTKLCSLFTLLALFVGIHNATADVSWSYWQPLGQQVSVSFSEVPGSSTWTWKFRNDGATAITYMDFYYTDNTGKHTDVLPGRLNPGQTFGGWAAFTASSAPIILIKTIQRGSS